MFPPIIRPHDSFCLKLEEKSKDCVSLEAEKAAVEKSQTVCAHMVSNGTVVTLVREGLEPQTQRGMH